MKTNNIKIDFGYLNGLDNKQYDMFEKILNMMKGCEDHATSSSSPCPGVTEYEITANGVQLSYMVDHS